ncbi:hypothetical protein BDV41DRAFT_584407 [Aspergillus transmontanensis]|uniref:Uncharacterized protein n=1 Tax=Aspergillus transmontanensis TaxID=1034304 RepID=A0A5N6VH70_9EURO|nr:hypothetical protein BDV41DRAFT_584407 [Aspergillus transmontanensis]
MALSDDIPYDAERFAKDVKRYGVATVNQPHIHAIGPEEINEDGTIDASEEFDAASRELRRGVTMFVTGDEAKANPERSSDKLNVVIRPRELYFLDKLKEAGHDEVYFTWGFGDDAQTKSSHRTPEFGRVKDIATIVCWEADHSNTARHDKLINGMRHLAQLASDLTFRISDGPKDKSISELVGQLPYYSELTTLAFYIENIATMIAGLLEWLRNKDYLVCEHNYG